MEQAVPMQTYQLAQQAPAGVAPQLLSNVGQVPLPQQPPAQPAVPHAAAAAGQRLLGGVQVPVQPAAAPMQPAHTTVPPGAVPFQLPMPGAAVPRPPGAAMAPAPAPAAAPRPVMAPQQAAAAALLGQLPPQLPPGMLPLLGYPLPLLQSVQSISVDELSKHTGFPLQLLQSNPQMQVAARQLMLQRIMALQLQAQQQRPGLMLAQQQAALAAVAQQQQMQQRAAAAAAPKQPKAPKAPKAPRQPKAEKKQRQQQEKPTSSGEGGTQYVGGKLIWAKLSNYPWWPAKTLSESDPSFPPDADPPRPTSIPIRFFGTYEFCWIGSKRAIADWDEAYDEHVRSCDQDSFRAAVQEVEHFKRTGELPQVFYIRPAPEGRAKARGKRRPRPRSAATPGGAGGLLGGEDAYGATPGSAPTGAKPRPSGKTPAEDRAAVVRARRKRLLQELGLAAPDESPYANGRICPNPELLKMEAQFEEQWPAASRPQPEPEPEPEPAPAPAPVAPVAAAVAPPMATAAPQAMAAAPQAAAAAGLGPAAGLAAALAGRPVPQQVGALPPGMGAVPPQLAAGLAAQQQLQQQQQQAAAALAQQQQHAAAAAAAAAAATAQMPQQYVGHPVAQSQPQPSQVPLSHLHQLTPQQQVALMAQLVQGQQAGMVQQHPGHM